MEDTIITILIVMCSDNSMPDKIVRGILREVSRIVWYFGEHYIHLWCLNAYLCSVIIILIMPALKTQCGHLGHCTRTSNRLPHSHVSTHAHLLECSKFMCKILKQVNTLFLGITFVREVGLCMCVYIHVYVHPYRLLIDY